MQQFIAFSRIQTMGAPMPTAKRSPQRGMIKGRPARGFDASRASDGSRCSRTPTRATLIGNGFSRFSKRSPRTSPVAGLREQPSAARPCWQGYCDADVAAASCPCVTPAASTTCYGIAASAAGSTTRSRNALPSGACRWTMRSVVSCSVWCNPRRWRVPWWLARKTSGNKTTP